MKQTIKIVETEEKTSNAGKTYLRVLTDEGWMTAFDKDIIEYMKSNSEAVIEVAESKDGNFKNIRKLYSDNKGNTPLSNATQNEANAAKKMLSTPVVNRQDDIQKGVAMRFAVDLVIAGKIEMNAIHKTTEDLLQIMRVLR